MTNPFGRQGFSAKLNDDLNRLTPTTIKEQNDFEARLKAREDFFRLMSHEIRTPLNGVMGMMSLLTRTPLNAEQSAYVQTAKDSGEHLLTLVNDLMDYARIDAGHIDLEITPVALEPLLQGVAELLSPRAFQNGIDIVWSLDPSLALIHSDEGRLRQILFNLAGNAIKFTTKGGVHIHVGLTPNGRIDFSVTDSGPGIPQEARARIFEAFGQVETSHATLYGGAGLGLVVVQKLVDAMSGEVSLDSEVGKGSEFSVSFQAPFGLAKTTPSDTNQKHTTRPICLYSDNDFLIAGATSHLKSYAIDLKAEKQLNRLESSAIILADRYMFKDGVTKPPSPKSLILLAPEQRDEIAAWKEAGWAGYLIKPLRRSSLFERVTALADPETKLPKTRTKPNAQSHEDDRVAQSCGVDMNVLLVEDNPVNAVLAQILLQREGCRVERAASGEDALSILAARSFDLVFMDLGLPGIDGLGATRAIRKSKCYVPIIALTANAFEEDRRACLNAGMNDFMTKPIEISELRQKLLAWSKHEITSEFMNVTQKHAR